MTTETDILLLAASFVALVTGGVHSVLGEYLIFRHLRNSGVLPNSGAPPLKLRNLRIIWASWHIVTVFGWLIAFFLFKIATSPVSEPNEAMLLNAIAITTATSGILVLYATRGKHPGWIALLSIAILIMASAHGT